MISDEHRWIIDEEKTVIHILGIAEVPLSKAYCSLGTIACVAAPSLISSTLFFFFPKFLIIV